MDGAPGSFADEFGRRRFEIGHRETLPLDRITGAFKLAGQPFAACHVARPTRPFVAEADIAQQAIGRASCWERVCQYVQISVVAVSLNTKTKQIHTTSNAHKKQKHKKTT